MILYQLQHLVGMGNLFKGFSIKPEPGIHSTPYVITWVINFFPLTGHNFCSQQLSLWEELQRRFWIQCEKLTSVLFFIKDLDMNLSLSWKELGFITAHKCWHQQVNWLLLSYGLYFQYPVSKYVSLNGSRILFTQLLQPNINENEVGWFH